MWRYSILTSLIRPQVKIMWPRNDTNVGPGADMTSSRKSKNTGFSGFVSFMRRKDAEASLREFDGVEWGGAVLRVGEYPIIFHTKLLYPCFVTQVGVKQYQSLRRPNIVSYIFGRRSRL